MSYRKGEPNTQKFIPPFTIEQWIDFRERLNDIIKNNKVSDRNQRILTEIIINHKTTAQLAYLARTDEEYSWLQSNQNKPLCERQIGNILRDNFPEFHIKTTHKKTDKISKIRREQNVIRKTMITSDSVCGKCGSKEDLEIHHMLPVVLGGDNDDRNLIILCHDCHHQTTNYFNTKLKNIKKNGIEVSE